MKTTQIRSLWPRVRNFTVLTYLLTVTSCKEDMNRPEITYNDHMVTVTSTQSNEVAKQMTWIAKGVAGIAHQSSLAKGKIHNLVEATDFYAETNTNLDDNMAASIGFDYDQEVNNWLQTNVAGNDYDQAYFFDINIDACPGKVSIRIPEADIVDKTKLHVVTPENVFNNVETTTGYFITSGGVLDSLIITEDNMDSVYLWVVGLENDCGNGFTPICGDSICQSWYGETAETCPGDCPDKKSKRKPVGTEYNLIVKDLIINTDKKKAGGAHPNIHYQEAHLQGKYDICVGLGIYDATDLTISQWGFDNDPILTPMGATGVGPTIPIGSYDAWGKNCDIRRYNGQNGKSNRGKNGTHLKNLTVSSSYFPNSDNIIFVLSEFDKNSAQWQWPDNGETRTNGKCYTYKPGQNNGIIVPPGVNLNDNWLVIENSGGGFLSPPGAPWVAVSGGIYEATLLLDGEMSVVLQITPK